MLCSKTETEQRNWILGYLFDNTKEGETDKADILVKGLKVCQMPWLQMHNLKDKYRQIAQDFKEGLKEYKQKKDQKKPRMQQKAALLKCSSSLMHWVISSQTEAGFILFQMYNIQKDQKWNTGWVCVPDPVQHDMEWPLSKCQHPKGTDKII